jgi:hypothetical protein
LTGHRIPRPLFRLGKEKESKNIQNKGQRKEQTNERRIKTYSQFSGNKEMLCANFSIIIKMQYFLSRNILKLVNIHLPSASQEVLDLLKERERVNRGRYS